jgi:two-component system, OmpR family, phosphate regulon sensor histidine kinase PhoR
MSPENLDAYSQIFTTACNALLDGLTDALLLCDEHGAICYANVAAKEMFAGRELMGRAPQDLFPDSRFMQMIETCRSTGTSVSKRLVLPQQLSPLGYKENRGDNCWLVELAMLPEQAHPMARLRILLRDLTAEHQSEQVRKDFVANASHELRTPLAIIQGYLENLLENGGLRDVAQAQRFLHIMDKHTERVVRIIDDMLMISRLESGEVALLRQEPFDFHSCVNDVLERLEHMIHSQAAIIDTSGVDTKFVINGDRFYWTQVLFNLVENALKQNPKHGLVITLSASVNNGVASIAVADNGIGIPLAHLPFIFKRFYRVDTNHTNSSIKGTGLGLSIVKRAIEAHGGDISVSSSPLRETKFTIIVPA